MIRIKLVLGFLGLILSVALVSLVFLDLARNENPTPAEFSLGVTAGGSVEDTKMLIDKVKDYANLIVITNLEVTKNRTSLEEVSNYASKSGLSFLVYMVYPAPHANFTYDPITWVSEAKIKYGNRFLGYYLYDEPGGHQLDRGSFRQFDNTTMPYDYRDAANTYTYYLYSQMRDFIKTDGLFTSDYALYWYDYEAGFDAVFCHFGWNNSRAVNIALCRGAAEMHNKAWGVMVAWTYSEEPYIEPAPELYLDMVTAYQAGAKYVIVFNYADSMPSGILTEEHFNAIKEFRDFASENPQNKSSNTERVAYVLPDNYGWGFRNPEDTLWGVWSADNKSQVIWDGVQSLVQTHGYNFDVVYGSPMTRFFGRYHYDNLIWWNSTE